MAFISFDNAESVDAAIAHGVHAIGGANLEAKWADPKPEQKAGRGRIGSRSGYEQAAPFRGSGHGDEYYHQVPFHDRGGFDNTTPPRPPRYRIFIRELPDDLSEEVLKSHFEAFGPVSDCYIPVTQGNFLACNTSSLMCPQSERVGHSFHSFDARTASLLNRIATLRRSSPRNRLHQLQDRAAAGSMLGSCQA
jgi:hypothetical protein